ncbi:hypothetical protein [Sphingomonas sp. Leaf38]|uniref:hypothetical protein n=1 Tax=Sphingomonas sp. Leaf38 TaxID=1736217 RepID=UPI0006FCCBFE|nr:hypothetical protein [Sphingomonas sp. Leaf38]KQN27879.1 hypothetical protein ASE88_16340 [Sphingomonas sp. Leaf38]
MTQISRWKRPLRIAIEMAAGFAALVAVDAWLTGGTGFARIEPNPLWIPVLAMALAYGTGPGLVAAAAASALWLAHGHTVAPERDYLDHVLHLSVQPLLWFVVAIAIGEVTILRTARHHRLEKHARTATRNVARLTEAFATLSRTNRALQVQIATEDRTAGHVIDVATRLSSADAAERRDAIGALIALSARTEDFTCYRITGRDARAWLHGPVTAGRREILPAALLERVERAQQAKQRGGILHVARRGDRRVLDGIGVAAIALADRASGEIVGCLVLHTLPFEALDARRTADLAEIAAWLTPLLADTLRAAPWTLRSAERVA